MPLRRIFGFESSEKEEKSQIKNNLLEMEGEQTG